MRIPFFLFEAVISLYPAAANGAALTGAAIYTGAVANQFSASTQFTGPRIGASGDAYALPRHTDEHHEIDIEKTWIVQAELPATFTPSRRGLYVMEIVWQSQKVWFKRTYFGVTGESATLNSRGVLDFRQGQKFHAQRFVESGGTVTASVFTPLNPATTETPVGFFHEDPMPVGAYMLGTYRWERTVMMTFASVIASAPQTTPLVLELELDGVLTGNQLTVPAGAMNAEVQASASYSDVTINAGQTVRWKAVSGPDSGEEAAWQIGLMMRVKG